MACVPPAQRYRAARPRAPDDLRRTAAGHRLRTAAGFTGLRVARHRRWTGTLRRPRAVPLRLLAQRPAGSAGQLHPPDRRGRASRSVDRDQGCRARPLEPRDRHLHASTATIRPIPARSRATPRARCWSMRAAASGSERAMRASTYSIPPPGASSICATIRRTRLP